jgi:hypothetical protein
VWGGILIPILNINILSDDSFLVLGKLLVTAGRGVGSKKSEVFDLINTKNTCKPLADFPVDNVYGSTGGLLDNKFPLICGGATDIPTYYQTNKKRYLHCTVYGKLSKSWSAAEKLSPNYYSASTVINGSTLWLTGGYGAKLVTKSTKFIDMTGARAGPDLPIPLLYHCVVLVNKTSAFVIGGKSPKIGVSNLGANLKILHV